MTMNYHGSSDSGLWAWPSVPPSTLSEVIQSQWSWLNFSKLKEKFNQFLGCVTNITCLVIWEIIQIIIGGSPIGVSSYSELYHSKQLLTPSGEDVWSEKHDRTRQYHQNGKPLDCSVQDHSSALCAQDFIMVYRVWGLSRLGWGGMPSVL